MLLSNLIGFESSPIFRNNKSTTLETAAGHGTRPEAKLQYITNLVTRVLICFVQLLCYDTQRYEVPNYDKYKAMFSGCAIFNRQLHNRTFPYALPRNANTAVVKNLWNYLFTSALINTWNAWKAILKQRGSDYPPPEFTDFCDQLAIDIVEKRCFH